MIVGEIQITFGNYTEPLTIYYTLKPIDFQILKIKF